MAVKNNPNAMLAKLKIQVRKLESKEAKAKVKLRAALAKMRKLSRSYKSRLASKMHVMKGKIAEAQSSTYANAAVQLERQIVKGIETKGKAITAALSKIEKKFTARLTKSISKKSKKAGKVKKVRKAAPVKKAKTRGHNKK